MGYESDAHMRFALIIIATLSLGKRYINAINAIGDAIVHVTHLSGAIYQCRPFVIDIGIDGLADGSFGDVEAFWAQSFLKYAVKRLIDGRPWW